MDITTVTTTTNNNNFKKYFLFYFYIFNQVPIFEHYYTSLSIKKLIQVCFSNQ